MSAHEWGVHGIKSTFTIISIHMILIVIKIVSPSQQQEIGGKVGESKWK